MQPEKLLPEGGALTNLEVSLESGASVEIPVITLKGTGSSPHLLAVVAQHGIELNSIVACLQFLSRLEAKRLAGSFTCVPLANPLAFRYRRHYLEQQPEEPYSGQHPHNMNRTWPGDASGNDTERLSAAIWPLVEQADYVLDFHSFEALSASAVLCRSDMLELGKAFGLPRLEVSPATAAPAAGREGKMLQAQALALGKPSLTLELRGQYHIWPSSVAEGVRGLANIFAYLGMYAGTPELPERYYLSNECESVWVKAPVEGVFTPGAEPGREVEAGEELGRLWAPSSAEVWPITAPCGGFLHSVGPIRPHGDVALSQQHAGVQAGEKLIRLLVPKTD